MRDQAEASCHLYLETCLTWPAINRGNNMACNATYQVFGEEGCTDAKPIIVTKGGGGGETSQTCHTVSMTSTCTLVLHADQITAKGAAKQMEL